jgi:hypothetical protein
MDEEDLVLATFTASPDDKFSNRSNIIAVQIIYSMSSHEPEQRAVIAVDIKP